jgi:hypothetical protein
MVLGVALDEIQEHQLDELQGVALWLADERGKTRVVVREGTLSHFEPTSVPGETQP